MPWLDKPAAVYVRHEVVLHRIDEPLIVHDSTGSRPVAYECWSMTIVYSWWAEKGRWEVSRTEMLGNRKGQRGNQQISIPVGHPERHRLAEEHAPDWIPDPSKARLHLPAEDVWDEAVQKACDTVSGSGWAGVVNPYRGE